MGLVRERKFSKEELFLHTEQLLLQVGLEGFTIGQLAQKLDISRAAIYKYYSNKEFLIMDYMVHHMVIFIEKLNFISTGKNFQEQFDLLLSMIFQYKDIHQILGMATMIEDHNEEEIIHKKQLLNELHLKMYPPLYQMVALGKMEGKLNASLSEHLILGFIFQSISIQNHGNMPEEDFIQSIKELICYGIFRSN